MKIFTTIKHWQLFFIVVVIPGIIQGILFLVFVEERKFQLFFAFAIKCILPFSIIVFAWLWTMGIFLYKKIPKEIKLNLRLFRMAMIMAIFGIIFLDLFVGKKFFTQPESVLSKVSLFLNPLCFLCLLYCVNFNAKALKSIEWQGAVDFGNYKREFILLFLFPIGIWFIQPRINSLTENE